MSEPANIITPEPYKIQSFSFRPRPFLPNHFLIPFPIRGTKRKLSNLRYKKSFGFLGCVPLCYGQFPIREQRISQSGILRLRRVAAGNIFLSAAVRSPRSVFLSNRKNFLFDKKSCLSSTMIRLNTQLSLFRRFIAMNYSSEIAPEGQVPAQAPQEIHVSASIS